MLIIRANTQEEINIQFKERVVEVKNSVIDAILGVLEGDDEAAVFCKLMPQDVALKIEKHDYLNGLENNMDILITQEDYEKAVKVRDWVEKLKKDPELLK